MSKRKLTILIIILIILAILAFLFFYFYKGKTSPTNNSGDVNFPAGFGKNTNTGTDNNTPVDITGTGTGDGAGDTTQVDIILKKVSSMPVAGFGIFTKERLKDVPVVTPPEASSAPTPAPTISKTITKTKSPAPTRTEFVPAVRYVARATGNIYQTFADKINEQKFSSTIIPKIYDAYFDAKAESVVMRHLNETDQRTIETFAGYLPKEILNVDTNGNNEIKGSFLPEDITDISLSPDLSKIFYLFKNTASIAGVTSSLTGAAKTEVFDSPFTEWLSMWPNANMITITTKPTGTLPGYMYAIDPNKKDLNKILGNINGLTTLTSPDGKNVLYGNNNLSLGLYNINTKNITPIGLRTMPEKCVWGKASDVVYCAVPKSVPQGLYPDSWYRGGISFSDQIWKVNIKDGSTNIIVDPISIVGGEDIDGIKLALDKDQNYLFFVNKKDSFLWELELK